MVGGFAGVMLGFFLFCHIFFKKTIELFRGRAAGGNLKKEGTMAGKR
ncbi:MAG: hypothetical protein FWG62_02595 [Proteobacteria bacterium]|nr:hypothetical protein [Pseudomonadota bacterium]